MDIKGGNLTKHRKNIAVLGLLIAIAVTGLLGRLAFLMILRSEHYSKMALELHQRERSIKAARGRILDTKGKVIADNRTVCTVSVIYNQVKDREKVAEELSSLLGIDKEAVRKKVEKRSVREIIKNHLGKITKSEIMEKCPDISQITVQRALAELLKSGEIIKLSGGRYTAYTWNRERE